ncbi:kinase domain-containing protein [Salix suchowensis]|nr:kinase domain-containing protein [Salix suchowensis]
MRDSTVEAKRSRPHRISARMFRCERGKLSRVATTSRRTQSEREARGQKLPCLVTVDHSLVAYSAVTVANDSPSTMGSRRPLPALPTMRAEYYHDLPRSPAMYSATNPYFNSQVPYSPFSDHRAPDLREEPTSSVPVGTMLHKGFYDLLAMIPTPSPSRLLWGPPAPSEPIVAGPDTRKYLLVYPRHKARRAGYLCKCIAYGPQERSEDQPGRGPPHALGPDGLGKLGDPRWANPIKDRVRQINQARAVNEVVNALKPCQDSRDDFRGPLRVVNGISSATSSTLTTAARENFRVNPVHVEGLPGRPGNSTIRWEGGLKTHLEARIYFENLYFPLFRQPPSREQRRLAMEKDMAQMQLSEAQKENLRARWRQNETDYLRERRRKVDVSAFIKLKTIGHGAFGVVSLVKEQHTNQLYAMKQLRKADMLRKGQEGHVRAERDILKSASMVHSPGSAEWIVKLHYSFQDRDNLYLVLEYMGGGDLLNLLIERDVFEEDFTRFYVAEMVLAIESCHKLGFIHRDIKPDTTLDYEQQRLQLLHKHGIDLKIVTACRCQVQLYNRLSVSPEVIRGHGYSYSCDWWSLGVIMFECLYGCVSSQPPPCPALLTPAPQRHVTRQKILNWKQSLRFPSRPRVSHEGVSLMQQLLCEPEDRLGSQTSASVMRPDSMVVQARRSGFINPSGSTTSVDGVEHIKVNSNSSQLSSGFNVSNLHRLIRGSRELIGPTFTGTLHPTARTTQPRGHKALRPRYPTRTLAPANGAPADATKDLMLRDKVHGAEILDVRKALAFAGFTHKSPRAITYLRADQAFETTPDIDSNATVRGRSRVREMRDVGKGRAISM